MCRSAKPNRFRCSRHGSISRCPHCSPRASRLPASNWMVCRSMAQPCRKYRHGCKKSPPTPRIRLSQGKLEADGVQLSGISGELSFSQAGKFTQAKLHAEGNKLALDINAMPENKMQVSIAVRGGGGARGPGWGCGWVGWEGGAD